MKAILDILNKGGVHLPTVNNWMEIARLAYPNGDNYDDTLMLMSRFEELTRGKMQENKSGGAELLYYATDTNALISLGDYSFLSDDDKDKCTPVYSDVVSFAMENNVWQPVLLDRSMFEAGEWVYEDNTVLVTSDLQISPGKKKVWRKIEKPVAYEPQYAETDLYANDLAIWSKVQERVWFEGCTVIKEGMIEMKSRNMVAPTHYNFKDKRMFDFIYECEKYHFDVFFSEQFAKQLIQ